MAGLKYNSNKPFDHQVERALNVLDQSRAKNVIVEEFFNAAIGNDGSGRERTVAENAVFRKKNNIADRLVACAAHDPEKFPYLSHDVITDKSAAGVQHPEERRHDGLVMPFVDGDLDLDKIVDLTLYGHQVSDMGLLLDIMENSGVKGLRAPWGWVSRRYASVFEEQQELLDYIYRLADLDDYFKEDLTPLQLYKLGF